MREGIPSPSFSPNRFVLRSASDSVRSREAEACASTLLFGGKERFEHSQRTESSIPIPVSLTPIASYSPSSSGHLLLRETSAEGVDGEHTGLRHGVARVHARLRMTCSVASSPGSMFPFSVPKPEFQFDALVEDAREHPAELGVS